MAKISSDGKIPKQIEDYIVYTLNGDYIMRRKSGFTSKKMKIDPKYRQSRNNAAEFGKVSSLCKKIRMALEGILPKKNNLAICNSLVKMMHHLLVFDIESIRGQRNLLKAFENEKGRQSLEGCHLNPDSLVHGTFKESLVLDNCGNLLVSSINIDANIVFPTDSNSFGMRLHHLDFDFSDGESKLISSDWAFFKEDSVIDSFLLPCEFTVEQKGIRFSILEIQFYVSENASLIPVQDDTTKLISIINVAL